jgi:hypothetical protein
MMMCKIEVFMMMGSTPALPDAGLKPHSKGYYALSIRL